LSFFSPVLKRKLDIKNANIRRRDFGGLSGEIEDMQDEKVMWGKGPGKKKSTWDVEIIVCNRLHADVHKMCLFYLLLGWFSA
jgi:hypothetical protein